MRVPAYHPVAASCQGFRRDFGLAGLLAFVHQAHFCKTWQAKSFAGKRSRRAPSQRFERPPGG
jgi:hypothetical protein